MERIYIVKAGNEGETAMTVQGVFTQSKIAYDMLHGIELFRGEKKGIDTYTVLDDGDTELESFRIIEADDLAKTRRQAHKDGDLSVTGS